MTITSSIYRGSITSVTIHTWAYTEIVSPAEQIVTCVLTTNGPADVWLNGAHIHRQEHFHHQLPKRIAFDLPLQPGPNKLLVRFERVAARECPYRDGDADRGGVLR